MIRRLLALCCILSAATAAPAAEDPSLTPAPDPAKPEAFAERWRIHVDLDGDGIEDLLLSQTLPGFGKAGGQWTVYLSRRGEYVEKGVIFAHPKAISFEPDPDRIRKDEAERWHCRIWTYLRAGNGEGKLSCARVGEKLVKLQEGLSILPGDRGTELGNRVYAAVFDDSPISFRLEKSDTSSDGTVHWAAAS